jgi:hypothetical protein
MTMMTSAANRVDMLYTVWTGSELEQRKGVEEDEEGEGEG